MIMIWLIVDHPSIQGVSATTIVNTYQYALSMYPRIAAQLIFHLRFTLNLVPFDSDTHKFDGRSNRQVIRSRRPEAV